MSYNPPFSNLDNQRIFEAVTNSGGGGNPPNSNVFLQGFSENNFSNLQADIQNWLNINPTKTILNFVMAQHTGASDAHTAIIIYK